MGGVSRPAGRKSSEPMMPLKPYTFQSKNQWKAILLQRQETSSNTEDRCSFVLNSI